MFLLNEQIIWYDFAFNMCLKRVEAAMIWWLTIKRTIRGSVFHKFCDQRKLLFLYKIQKKLEWHSFTNPTSGLQCHDFIESVMDFTAMVSAILQTNFVNYIRMWNYINNNVKYSVILICLWNVMFMFIQCNIL